ncbi:phenylalanyl-tRNA synthetase beta subunit [Trichodesmium erythraeum IMS101]|uniref:Phenylalanine--tRNA ligase beta subunit n=1 Tax=Trichodesmium erythraeum (strain IMS101) TaxID=203124 RepID=Q113M0_TRIEI|nr:phenylalanine--tRNA ligase subunit beta [Trichodesmium erythraeum GBRTRLIN201]MDE5095707.1 phenylalanine--tRNA ligase subunit beta [Trichodesmium sp. St11_bin5]
MRISLKWLEELVDINITPEELAETLTMAGFEVEEIEDRSTWSAGVVLGKILEADKHPNANKLKVCQVDIGKSDPLNIVCGASNATADIYVPVATIGTYLPAIDLKIKKSKLRGVHSEGMICSLSELGLTKDSEGIHIFDLENPELGSDVGPLLGLDDVILDLTTTANRADALSMIGVAREVAALTGASLRIPDVSEILIPDEEGDSSIKIDISASSACPIYIGTVIEGVKIGPSPKWLKERLEATGIRAINNVVDITNYILLEWGQPLHGFDQDKIQQIIGHKLLTIGVRYANENEELITLDSQKRTLETETLLITANEKPVALAGVMGGEETEVSDQTTNLLLEAAIFAPIAIRRSARSQGLRTEASTRFERGVNTAELVLACSRAIHLITELAGGKVSYQDTFTTKADSITATRKLSLSLERINAILGPLKPSENTLDESFLQPEAVEGILKSLGCELSKIEAKGAVGWNVTVPAYRYRDLEREIDLIEEVARLYGYDNFCETLPSKSAAGYLPPGELAVRSIRAALRGAGLTELMHYSLVKQGGENQIAIANPLFVEYSALRTELLTGLIDAFQYNLEKGNGALNGFEVGRIFWNEVEKYQEAEAIAGVISNGSKSWTRGGQEQPLSWFEAKGILEQVFERLYLKVEYKAYSENSLLHPGRTASLWLQGKYLGIFGQLHPQVRQERELPDEVYVFQLDLGVLVSVMTQGNIWKRKFSSYSTFPPAARDIAFFVTVGVSVDDIKQVISRAAGKLLESIELFDEYQGENVPDGERSLAFRLIYRVGDRTLTDADVDPLQQKVRDALVDKFKVNLRS